MTSTVSMMTLSYLPYHTHPGLIHMYFMDITLKADRALCGYFDDSLVLVHA